MRKIFVFAMLAVPALSAQSDLLGDFFAQWGVPAVSAALLAISAMLAGLVYMLGIFLSNEKVKLWAKTEVVEIFYSGAILAAIVGMVVIASDAADSLVREFDPFTAGIVCDSGNPLFSFTNEHGTPFDYGYAYLPCHMRVAKNFLATLFYETAGFVKSVGVVYSWYTYLSSWSFDFTPVGTTTFFSGGGFSHAIFGFLNAKNNAFGYMFNTGVKALTLIRFQEVLLNFAAIALFPVLLSAGAILRTFMLTRKLGGLLMALALSLYFIYPVFYVVGDIVLNAVKAGSCDTSLPPEERPALVCVFTDFSALPPKLNSSAGYADSPEQVKTLVTNGELVSASIIDQLNQLTSTQKCVEELEQVEADEDTSTLLEKFHTENKLLGDWLSGAFSKGGRWNPVSFKSVLNGIDVLAKALFFSVFFSFLSIFSAIAAVKSLSPMLGGDVEIAGLTHLI